MTRDGETLEVKVAKIEQELSDHGKVLDRIELKVDSALSCKAEKSDVKEINERTWGSVFGMVLLLGGVIEAIVRSWK